MQTPATHPAAAARAVRRRWTQLLLAAGLASCLGLAQAADWPARPVKIVVPFAAGGTTDLIARLIAAPMSQQLGQSVVIENRPGAGGLLARTRSQNPRRTATPC